jgi:ribokinase
MADALARVGVLTLDPYPHVMAEATDRDLRALLAPVAAFLPSHEEARARFPGLPAEQAVERLAALGSAAVVLKQGRRGALVWDRAEGRTFVVPAVPVTAKDPTGAGDAFCGGVLAGLVEGRGVLEAVVRGAVSASFIVEDFCLDGALRADVAERDRRVRWVLERVR